MEKYKLGLLLVKYRLTGSHKARLDVIRQLARVGNELAEPAGETARQILRLDPAEPAYGGTMEKLGRVLYRQLTDAYREMR